jgi:D-sedoheptulose 7-phosphate isomerase
MTASTFVQQYLDEAVAIIEQLPKDTIETAAALLAETRARGGRLFILGVGGSAANASHAVNDFRKIAGIEAYAPTDNVSELTARTNDEGWASVFESWLRVSRLNARDLVLVLSVGGGNLEKNVSPNLVAALQLAKSVGARIIGVVGRDGGYTARVADACVIVPTVNPTHVTPHSEAFQAVVWHLLVSHPSVKRAETKWESVKSSLPDPVGRRAVFLDRDGVIDRARIQNGKPVPPATLAELEIFPDASAALADLKRHGFLLIVVTNQPDVARGTQQRETVEQINLALASALPIDQVLVCYHSGQSECDCRKPLPGLLLRAAREHQIDLLRSFMVGDRWRDIDAGHNAGCQTVLIDYAYKERSPERAATARVKSLREAADWIIESISKGAENEIRV